jgi:hypothetical protein
MGDGNSSPNFFKIKIKNMNYSFFLFTKLHDVVFGQSNDPYDYQFEDLVDLYGTYESSKFNRSDIDEYTCMVNFLNDIKTIA